MKEVTGQEPTMAQLLQEQARQVQDMVKTVV